MAIADFRTQEAGDNLKRVARMSVDSAQSLGAAGDVGENWTCPFPDRLSAVRWNAQVAAFQIRSRSGSTDMFDRTSSEAAKTLWDCWATELSWMPDDKQRRIFNLLVGPLGATAARYPKDW